MTDATSNNVTSHEISLKLISLRTCDFRKDVNVSYLVERANTLKWGLKKQSITFFINRPHLQTSNKQRTHSIVSEDAAENTIIHLGKGISKPRKVSAQHRDEKLNRLPLRLVLYLVVTISGWSYQTSFLNQFKTSFSILFPPQNRRLKPWSWVYLSCSGKIEVCISLEYWFAWASTYSRMKYPSH